MGLNSIGAELRGFLTKGTTIPWHKIKNWAKQEGYRGELNLFALNITQAIKKMMSDVCPTVRINSVTGIQILTDSEAAAYNVRLFKSGEKRLRKARRQKAAVKLDKLSPVERTEHNEELSRMTFKLMVMSKAEKEKVEMTDEEEFFKANTKS